MKAACAEDRGAESGDKICSRKVKRQRLQRSGWLGRRHLEMASGMGAKTRFCSGALPLKPGSVD